MLGIFLHSCNAPETVVELLSRMSLSIASSTISDAVRNLSKEAEQGIHLAGQSLLTAYAYDNLDIDFKKSTPTTDKNQDTLVHLTTGTMLPLAHATLNDLRCSEELWQKYYRNADLDPKDIPSVSIDKLHSIHPEQPHPSKLSRRNRFNAWKYRTDLVNYGPEYFRRFRSKLGDPEVVEQIPIPEETPKQVPLRAVDVSPSTPEGNVEALENFFAQAGVGDRADDPRVATSIGNHTILVFGDLLTGQHIRSVLESRSVEATPWRRFQFIVYVMGLFHLKMACADALWRIFIHPKKADIDSNSLMGLVSQIRPKETGKIKSKPGFRRMHEVIQHIGIVARLDLWRIAVSKQTPHTTLEAFADSEPSLDLIEEISLEIVREEAKFGDVTRLRMKPEAERDKQQENVFLLRRYFLLYEEISHAMNHGDIGRVETCFFPWMYIFLGCGKHKYAVEMRRYLENLHFIYPQGLRCYYSVVLQHLVLMIC